MHFGDKHYLIAHFSCHPRHNICAPASLGGGVQRRLNEKLNDTYKMLAGYQMLITCIAEADAFVRSAATTRERTVSKSSEDGLFAIFFCMKRA